MPREPSVAIVARRLDPALERGLEQPCRTHDADLWFAESPALLERAKLLCRGCSIRAECLAAALERREPWGVWGGEILHDGAVVPSKRPRGRPRKKDGESRRDRAAGPDLHGTGSMGS